MTERSARNMDMNELDKRVDKIGQQPRDKEWQQRVFKQPYQIKNRNNRHYRKQDTNYTIECKGLSNRFHNNVINL